MSDKWQLEDVVTFCRHLKDVYTWVLKFNYAVDYIFCQDFYKAASVHNPVENFATMSGTSDIPDWCYVQAGVKYDPILPPTSKDYTELLSHSPMSGCDKVHDSTYVQCTQWI